MSGTVLEFENVALSRDDRPVLSGISWTVRSDERWVILGPNGAGKTSLLEIAASMLYPTSGTATILGQTLGQADLFELRPMIGYASSAMAAKLPRKETVLNIVLGAAYAVNGKWFEESDELDVRRAKRVLAEWHLEDLEDRNFGSLSDGEQKRVQIARAVMTDPELLLLDEPAASLDLGAREDLVNLLGGYARTSTSPAMVMVTHHVEEIPQGFTHVLMISKGKVAAAGELSNVLTEANLNSVFHTDLELTTDRGRYWARARGL